MRRNTWKARRRTKPTAHDTSFTWYTTDRLFRVRLLKFMCAARISSFFRLSRFYPVPWKMAEVLNPSTGCDPSLRLCTQSKHLNSRYYFLYKADKSHEFFSVKTKSTSLIQKMVSSKVVVDHKYGKE